MPDFFVQATASPTPLVSALWEDAASVSRPSRITSSNDRTYRRTNIQRGSTLTLAAIVTGQAFPQPDSSIGLFTMWPLEVPNQSGGMPLQSIPTAGQSSIQTFLIDRIGHYTFAVRHENTEDAPSAFAGGVVVLHFECLETVT